MLTWAALEQLCVAGELVRWRVGKREIGPSGRGLYLIPDVNIALKERPWPSSSGERPEVTRQRRDAMRQVLERFVLGHNMRVKYDLKELGSERLDQAMRGFWEFRSQGRMHETRLFGFFARPGAYVATSFRSRDDFENKDDWIAERTKGQLAWDTIAKGETYLTEPWPVDRIISIEHYLNRTDD